MNVDGRLDWAVAARPLPGEVESGDCHYVQATPDGWLLAVADGLGHGPDAAAASRALLEILRRHGDESLVKLIERCHERLRPTRGAAISLASLDATQNRLSWIGIGNVEGLLRRDRAPHTLYITQRGGIVGAHLPRLRPTSVPLRDGDILVFATDGIRDDFAEAVSPELPPRTLAARLLDNFAKPDDDALVLVARWHCRRPPPGRIPG